MLFNNALVISQITAKKRMISAAITAFALSFCPVFPAAAVKIAFTGDQGVNQNAQAVLRLVASENADLLMIQGDLGYGVSAAAQWETNINDALGPDFPVLVVVGNHENFEWPIYKSLTEQRIGRAGGLSCDGNTGVKATCQFGNVDVVQVSAGINEVSGVSPDDGYADYIRSSFAEDKNRWRICTWHKNQNALQTGSKGDSTGWDIYKACLDAGAMVIVAHEHAYSRSYLLSDFQNQRIVNRESDMTLKPGQSFVAVSGLGGRDPRPQRRDGDWWASVYTASQGASSGALFCDFDDAVAQCYFKAINGAVPDRFTLRRGEQQLSNQAGYVFSRNDTDEFRWVDRTQQGGLGNVWIDRACADRLGGPSVFGDWSDLNDRAPNMDSITNPCDITPEDSGYVFSRSDKDEYRWIDRNADGELGSAWIDGSCANLLGGATATGDWSDLIARAPATDSIPHPCVASDAAPKTTPEIMGYVFTRTDREEYRWVIGDRNIWISKECALSLGGASASGDWGDLNDIAPRFDAIASPCS